MKFITFLTLFTALGLIAKEIEEEVLHLSPWVVAAEEFTKGDTMHPVPEGFTHKEYYFKRWDVTSPYTLFFTGKFEGTEAVFEFRFNESHAHAFPGFEFSEDKLVPRYVEIEELIDGKWIRPDIGFCATGDQTFILQPKRKYVVLVAEDFENCKSEALRLVLKGPKGMEFISEPFKKSEILIEPVAGTDGVR